MRSPHQGAAGRLAPGEMQLGAGAAVALPVPYAAGGPYASIPIDDTPVHIDLGSDLSFRGVWKVGWAGARYTFDDRQRDEAGERGEGGAFDAEVGTGVGYGGKLEGSTVDELMLGAYGGFGGAFHFNPWFALWARTRLQIAAGEHVPGTTWLSGVVGTEFDIGDTFALHLGTGYGGYVNHQDRNHSWLADAGVALHFDVFGNPSVDMTEW